MIITITGKPCSGKGTVAKIICDQHKFDYICTGDIFRELSKQNGFENVLEFQKNEDIKKVDNMVDSRTEEIGRTRSSDDIVFDSRMAWHFIPSSFKVYIDVDWEEAGRRLIEANRDSEQTDSLNDAINKLKERWQVENDRYKSLYNVNNLDLNQYDLVISSTNKTPDEIAETIMKEYNKFLKSRK